ncbi:MAG: hypothetical protein N4A46_08835 [Schleiferiaceae bacterium]|nr:hypothetical protein [Schleiferiaceae bacterium]
MNRIVLLRITLILSVSILVLFASGSALLVTPIFGNETLPLGNLLVWLGFISISTLFYCLDKEIYSGQTKVHGRYKMVFQVLIGLSLIWGFIAYGLSGNTQFNFINEPKIGPFLASNIYWILIYIMVLSPILTFIIYKLHAQLISKN